MYLIGIKENRYNLGNEGTQKTDYKSMWKINQIAKNFKTMYNHDEIYMLSNYSQKLCELDNNKFVEYIRKNCTKIL